VANTTERAKHARRIYKRRFAERITMLMLELTHLPTIWTPIEPFEIKLLHRDHSVCLKRLTYFDLPVGKPTLYLLNPLPCVRHVLRRGRERHIVGSQRG